MTEVKKMRKFISFLDPMPRVIAHRGDSRNYPENTLPAFLSAVGMGIDVIETEELSIQGQGGQALHTR